MSNETEIPFDEITFVIQGLVTPVVNRSIESIRTFLPGATVIVSTCNAIEIEIVGADEIVRSDDPGALRCEQIKAAAPNNVNRQLRSTLAGLKRVTTKYAFKLRSDFLMTGSSFLGYLKGFAKADPQYRIFNSRVLACCYFTRNPESRDPHPFHLSDLAFFGETADLLNLFDIPLLAQADALRTRVVNGKETTNYRYAPEQYLMLSWLRKNGHRVECEHYEDATAANCEQTARYLASNFVLLTFEQFCLQVTKDTFWMEVFPASFRSSYTHVEWQQLYKTFVDDRHAVPSQDAERERIQRFLRQIRKYQVAAKLCSSFIRDPLKRKQSRRRFLVKFRTLTLR